MTWKTTPIGTVIRTSQYGLSLPADPAGGIPIVGMKDIQDGRVRIDPEVRVSLTDEDAEPYLLKDGDILLNRTNSPDLVGKAGIYRGNGKAVFASYLVRLELDQTQVDPDFIIQILASEGGQRRIRQLATRAVSQANLNPTTFKNHFLIPLPAIKEQIGIRDVLMAWDTAIETTERLIAAKEAWASSTAKKLYRRKAHWQPRRLGSLLREVKALHGDETYVIGSVGKNGIKPRSEVYSRALSDNHERNILVRPGWLCFGLASDAMAFGVNITSQTYSVSPAYKTFQVVEADPRFVDGYLRVFNTRLSKRYLITSARQGKAIDFDGLLNVELHIPPLDEQRRIAEALAIMQREIDTFRAYLDALKRQKRGLMQKLLTGKWRIPMEEGVPA